MARRQLTLDNAVAAELAGAEDAVLKSLEGRLDAKVYLRGNVLTLEGEPEELQSAESMVDELVGLIERGHESPRARSTRSRARSRPTPAPPRSSTT